MAMIELTDKQILEVQAASRTRGLYKTAMEAFVESGVKGNRVDLESGEFAGKSAASVYQSMKAHAPDNVRVIKNDDGVFLINTDLV